MGGVTAQIVRKFVEVSRAPAGAAALLESVGLSLDMDSEAATRRFVPAHDYYELLERCGAGDDPGLPFRYAAALHPEDFGAFGLALKTAHSVGEALERLVRYILVVSDTLEYELVEQGAGHRFVLNGRPYEQRFGVRIANEAALAAVTSLIRRVAVQDVAPTSVSFRHPRPSNAEPHDEHFGCRVVFDANVDALHFSEHTLAVQTRLGDSALSAYLLAQVDMRYAELAEGALVVRVRRAIADSLCGGMLRKGGVARQLGMSERTLQRRLLESGKTFQKLVAEVRREMAESLLRTSDRSLGEVAFLTGFSDQSAFQRAFKGWTGTTPAEFRAGG